MLAQLPGRGGAFFLKRAVTKPAGHVRTRLHGSHGKGLKSGVDGRRSLRGRPVDEPAVLVILLGAVEVGHDGVQEVGQVRLLLAEVVKITVIFIKMVMDDDPP